MTCQLAESNPDNYFVSYVSCVSLVSSPGASLVPRGNAMEMEIVKRPTTSARRIAARRHRIRNNGRTNRVSHSKTKSYKKDLRIDRSRICGARRPLRGKAGENRFFETKPTKSFRISTDFRKWPKSKAIRSTNQAYTECLVGRTRPAKSDRAEDRRLEASVSRSGSGRGF